MNIMKIYRRFLIVTIMLSSILLIFMVGNYIDESLPEKITMEPNKVTKINVGVPVSLENKKTNEVTSVSPRLEINSTDNGKYSFIYRLMGVIPVKEVNVTVANSKTVIPLGIPVGLYLHTEGVMVIGEGELTDINGDIVSPAKDKVKPNDYIVSFNDTKVNSKSQLIFLINQNEGKKIEIGLKRNGKTLKVDIYPVKDEEGNYKLGIWVRDDTQGIGTMTFADSEGNFGALGHGVSDIDTGKLLDSTNGKIYKADIWGIKKGENGTPGGLCGTINYAEENILGFIDDNTNQGLYGELCENGMEEFEELQPMEIAYRHEIKKGDAYIQIMLDGKMQRYKVEITKININGSTKEKNFVIEVKDKELLKKTNGIVQGMSGSPVIQNDKLVGAVTHVFVDDPTRGYGIFIEEMLEH